MIRIQARAFSETQALQFMRDYYDLSREIRALEDRRGIFNSSLKEYLDQTGQILEDEERSLEARLQERVSPNEWDLTRTPEPLVLWAAKMGLLGIDNKLFENLQGKFIEVDDLKKYRMPGRPSVALVVRRKEAK